MCSCGYGLRYVLLNWVLRSLVSSLRRWLSKCLLLRFEWTVWLWVCDQMWHMNIYDNRRRYKWPQWKDCGTTGKAKTHRYQSPNGIYFFVLFRPDGRDRWRMMPNDESIIIYYSQCWYGLRLWRWFDHLQTQQQQKEKQFTEKKKKILFEKFFVLPWRPQRTETHSTKHAEKNII